MLLREETKCFAFLAGHESFAAAEGAIKIAAKADKVRKEPLRCILNGLGKDAAQIISRINGFTYVQTQFDYYTGELNVVREIAYSDGPRAKVKCYGADDVREGVAIMWKEGVDVSITGNSTNPTVVREIAYSDGPRAKVKCYGADDVREGVAIMWKEGVDVSITGNSTNPTRFQHPVAGTYKKERVLAGKPYFSVASGGGTGRTLHPDNMAAGPASYGMTDTMGRMHSDAQFAGSSSVPAHVEMMGFLGIGNNPMVGCTVAIAYSDGPRAKVKCYGADDVREGVAIMWKEGVDVSITGNSTNPTRFQHPVAGTYKKERVLAGKPYFSVASGGGTGRTLHPDNMAAGPASYGMTDTMGRMHSDAQFAGSSSVPAHVEMMGFLGIGNNPMVGCTVACAVDVATALSK